MYKVPHLILSLLYIVFQCLCLGTCFKIIEFEFFQIKNEWKVKFVDYG